MENLRIPSKASLSISHFPTWLLVIGFPIYWLELYFSSNNHGVTSYLATISFFCVLFLLSIKNFAALLSLVQRGWREFKQLSFAVQVFLIFSLACSVLILIVGFYASLLPPHLSQEYDSLNYHYTLPRQHLILNSFAHIPWSHADLFLLPIDFALAPFWFTSVLTHKWPQFVFFLGTLLISIQLLRFIKVPNLVSVCLLIFAILGSHNFGIQLGTAMLDIVICYLFLASLHSFIKGDYFWAAVEFAFFFWSKPFVPLQMTVLLGSLFILVFVFKRFGFNFYLSLENSKLVSLSIYKKFVLWFMLISLVVAGPFIVKSIHYAGTPLYPFAPGIIKTQAVDDALAHYQSIKASAEENIRGARESYGDHSWLGFITHFWGVAVPDKGVNNKFDYPLGLPYLLFLGPFVYFLIKSLNKKSVSLLAVFVVIYWGSWWLGSQQTRFLYIPIILMFIYFLERFDRPSIVLVALVALSVGFNALSITRAHKPDFFKRPEFVIREKDKTVLEMNKTYILEGKKDAVILENHDAPFAQFPFMVVKEHLPYVITY